MSLVKVRHLSDGTYQVVEYSPSDDEAYLYEDESVLYQGSIAECESFMRLQNAGLLD